MRYPSRRDAISGLFATSIAACATRAAAATDDVLHFSYFSAGRDVAPGSRRAASEDGLSFRPLRAGASLLTPEVGKRS